MTEERLKIWLNFWKWLISTVVVTGGITWATTIINAKHKDTQLRIQINKEEKEYLTSFLDRALDDNLEKRFRFAQYFAHVTASPEYKSGWTSYLEEVRKEVGDLKQEKNNLEKSLANKSGTELKRAKKRLVELQEQLRRQRSKKTTYHDLNSFEALLNQDLKCPENYSLSIWSELVGFDSIEEFPEPAQYIALGCKENNGTAISRYLAFYSDGSIIEDTIMNGTSTFYYPSGQKAGEFSRSSKHGYSIKKWSKTGEVIE